MIKAVGRQLGLTPRTRGTRSVTTQAKSNFNAKSRPSERSPGHVTETGPCHVTPLRSAPLRSARPSPDRTKSCSQSPLYKQEFSVNSRLIIVTSNVNRSRGRGLIT